jgi:hypothetical protein
MTLAAASRKDNIYNRYGVFSRHSSHLLQNGSGAPIMFGDV